MKTVTDQTFEDEVINSDELVLVKFWATWCQPCKLIQKYDRIKTVKVDVDRTNIAPDYGVRGIPTWILFKDGKPIDSILGGISEDTLDKFVNRHV